MYLVFFCFVLFFAVVKIKDRLNVEMGLIFFSYRIMLLMSTPRMMWNKENWVNFVTRFCQVGPWKQNPPDDIDLLPVAPHPINDHQRCSTRSAGIYPTPFTTLIMFSFCLCLRFLSFVCLCVWVRQIWVFITALWLPRSVTPGKFPNFVSLCLVPFLDSGIFGSASRDLFWSANEIMMQVK